MSVYLGNKNVGVVIPLDASGAPAASTYGGDDLSQVFASAAAFHTAIAAGDFSNIRIGDYWPITLNGSYKDFAKFTVPSGVSYYSDAALTTAAGTTASAYEGSYQSATAIKFKISGTDYYAAIGDCAAGFEKSMNAVMKMEVAAINPYLRHGDTELTAQHVLLCSRDCMPSALQMRCSGSVWYDDTQGNPWRGSALWETLNNASNGIIKLVEATALGPYIFAGPNGKGMRAQLATMAPGANAPTGQAWTDRGKLFLPTEREVYGAPVQSVSNYIGTGNLYNQWPIFAGSARHIVKGAGDGGSRCIWWLEGAYTSASFPYVLYFGSAAGDSAGADYVRAPLCCLLV